MWSNKKRAEKRVFYDNEELTITPRARLKRYCPPKIRNTNLGNRLAFLLGFKISQYSKKTNWMSHFLKQPDSGF